MSSEVFNRLAGATSVARALVDAASHPEHMTHAWLLTGPPGSGRSVAARAFAAALVCDTPGGYGCGQCEGCRMVFADTHPDVFHLVPEGVVIPVAQVRDRIIPLANTSPTHGRWRVIIIEDADRLGSESSNALLKTVEEPPERTVMIFCAPSTDPEDFSVTLRSRCRHLYIPMPSPEDVAELLMREGVANEQAAHLAAAASSGHIGRARHLATDTQAQKRRARVLQLAELVNHGSSAFQDVAALVKVIEDETESTLAAHNEKETDELKQSLGMGSRGKGTAAALRGSRGELKELEKQQKRRRTRSTQDALDLALTDLAGLYRDAIIVASAASTSLTHPDFAGLSRDLAEQVGVAGLLRCIDAIAECREMLTFNVRPTVALDAMIGKFRLAYGVEQ
ncbi:MULTISPECIES: DNA polymerase III subunit delta' [unclassified Corynebacterium]|uniref:DNA polymerase III subunit delta' n=1 Tax=unclassified Corynebacterium TaxID=2624378 RepID=UPI001C4917B9|nr:DNA polymerase III subunit delta' [Corynebacterium sp. TAE3-ERU30]MBV7302212.1 DNA polymerase III subunit delta' [Corynebacterium sp. TAE3-ERU2]